MPGHRERIKKSGARLFRAALISRALPRIAFRASAKTASRFSRKFVRPTASVSHGTIDNGVPRPRRRVRRRHPDRRSQHAEFFTSESAGRAKNPFSSSADVRHGSTNSSWPPSTFSPRAITTSALRARRAHLLRFFSQYPGSRRRPRRKKTQSPTHFVDPARHRQAPQSAAALPSRCRRWR